MKICFPIETDNGIDSVIYNHFGSAPGFVLVDTEDGTVRALTNADSVHSHGACSPIKALGGASVDALVVTGIGGGALQMLQRQGVAVLQAVAPTIAANIAIIKEGKSLPAYTGSCGGHGHGQSHAHGHGHGHGCAH